MTQPLKEYGSLAEEYRTLAQTHDILLAKELRDMFWNYSVVKEQVEGARHKSHTIQQVEDKVIEVLAEKDKERKWWYIIDNYSVSVYKEETLVRSVLVPKHYFDQTEAGNVSVMSPEQRTVSQMTYAQREALRLTFFIRTSFDPEVEYAQELNKVDMFIENYKERIQLLEGQEAKQDAQAKIEEDHRLTDKQKAELIILINSRP